MNNRTYKDNFSHNSIDVASHNRVNVKTDLAQASGLGITIAVCWLIIVFSATIIYLAIKHLQLLDSLILIVVIGSITLLVYAGINQAIRISAKTIATVSFHLAQKLRNPLIENQKCDCALRS